jgi:hypothetical protein
MPAQATARIVNPCSTAQMASGHCTTGLACRGVSPPGRAAWVRWSHHAGPRKGGPQYFHSARGCPLCSAVVVISGSSECLMRTNKTPASGAHLRMRLPRSGVTPSDYAPYCFFTCAAASRVTLPAVTRHLEVEKVRIAHGYSGDSTRMIAVLLAAAAAGSISRMTLSAAGLTGSPHRHTTFLTPSEAPHHVGVTVVSAANLAVGAGESLELAGCHGPGGQHWLGTCGRDDAALPLAAAAAEVAAR